MKIPKRFIRALDDLVESLPRTVRLYSSVTFRANRQEIIIWRNKSGVGGWMFQSSGGGGGGAGYRSFEGAMNAAILRASMTPPIRRSSSSRKKNSRSSGGSSGGMRGSSRKT